MLPNPVIIWLINTEPQIISRCILRNTHIHRLTPQALGTCFNKNVKYGASCTDISSYGGNQGPNSHKGKNLLWWALGKSPQMSTGPARCSTVQGRSSPSMCPSGEVGGRSAVHCCTVTLFSGSLTWGEFTLAKNVGYVTLPGSTSPGAPVPTINMKSTRERLVGKVLDHWVFHYW